MQIDSGQIKLEFVKQNMWLYNRRYNNDHKNNDVVKLGLFQIIQ